MHKYVFAIVKLFIVCGIAMSNAAILDTINGKVLDMATDSPIESVSISAQGVVTKTDANGIFKLVVPDTGIATSTVPRKISWDPARKDFSWSGNPKGVTIDIRNMAGRIIVSRQNDVSSSRLSIAHLPQGAYVATVRTLSAVNVFKIIIVETGAKNTHSIVVRPLSPGCLEKSASTVKGHSLVIRKAGYNVMVIAVPANTSSSDIVTTKLYKGEFDARFDPSTVPGIVPLFDGQTLNGWNHPGTWAFKDGAIMGGPGFWGFCATAGNYDKFRLFVSIIQDGKEGDGGHSGIGVAGSGTGGFHDIMTPSCGFWDYASNGADDGGTSKCVNLALPDTKPKTSPDQVYWHTEWFQLEMLVDITPAKGTIRAAMNGIDFLTHSFTPRNGGKAGPIGLQSHNGGSVRYKDIWIEVNPKQPDVLLSVKK